MGGVDLEFWARGMDFGVEYDGCVYFVLRFAYKHSCPIVPQTSVYILNSFGFNILVSMSP